MEFFVLFGAFAVFQVADVATTAIILSKAGGREANPIMAAVFEAVGFWPGIIMPKLLITFLMYWIGSTYGYEFLVLPDIIYAAVIAHNLKYV